MDQLRRILAQIGAQLAKLNATQRLLIAALALVVLMSFALVSLYAGSATTVPLLPNGSPDEQSKAAAFLDERAIAYRVNPDGKIAVAPDVRYTVLGQLTQAQVLPSKAVLDFNSLAAGQTWLEPLSTQQQKAQIALQNELSRIIANFSGIETAWVVISAPEARGLGAAVKKPVAQVTVRPRATPGSASGALPGTTVNALASLVAGSVAGLDVRDVVVIDASSGRSYRPNPADDSFGGTYLEHVAQTESRLESKLERHLSFIGGAIVSVNAIVDAATRHTTDTRYHAKGAGTLVTPVEEDSATSTDTSGSTAPAEPGIGPNIQMDLNRSSGSGTSTSSAEETSSVRNEVHPGSVTIRQKDAVGRPTKINVTLSVPRDYVEQVVRQKRGTAAAPGAGGAGGAAAPAEVTDADITQAWEGPTGLKSELESMIAPLVETEGLSPTPGGTIAAGPLVAGTVKAFLIPISAGFSGGGGGAAQAGFGGGATGMLSSAGALLENGLVKTVALGALALIAVGLMFTMVRKAGKAQPMPTAEELVGIPPALEPASDIVGEADETEAPMMGIEVDENELKTTKMLDEIGTLVKDNPQAAATVFNRWLTTEE